MKKLMIQMIPLIFSRQGWMQVSASFICELSDNGNNGGNGDEDNWLVAGSIGHYNPSLPGPSYGKEDFIKAVYSQKRNRFGIKLFVLCDCKTRYICDRI